MTPRPIIFAQCLRAKDEKSVVEDQILIDENSQTFVVVDGVGSSSGALSSASAIKTLNKIRPTLVNLYPQELVQIVDEELLAENQKRQTFISQNKPLMASIAIAQIRDKFLHYSNLGDTRVMCFRAGKLTSLTKDHTLLQEEIDKDYENFDETVLLKSPLRHVLTRSIGQINHDYPYGQTRIYEHDIIILCSDGLTHFVAHSKIEKTLINHCIDNINHRAENIVKELEELANQGKDDLSVILITL